MRQQKTFVTFAFMVAVAALPPGAIANTIIGGIHFSGDVTIVTDMSGNGSLEFDDVTMEPYTFTIDAATGDFTGLSGGGNELDIGAAASVGPPTVYAAPIDTIVNIPDFLTFQNSSDTFTLTEVLGGVDGTAGCSDNTTIQVPGSLCTPAGTPFNLQDLGGGNSSASFVVLGDIVDSGTDTAAEITFSSASTGKTFEQILNDQENGIPDTITYGAQLTSGVPEPPTLSLMLGAALIVTGRMFRRRNHQQTR